MKGFILLFLGIRHHHAAFGGDHYIQYMYGCSWDDETGEADGFRQLGYDGEDFLVYDMKRFTWIAPKQQAVFTQHKWNSDQAGLVFWKNYISQTCIDWLKKYLDYGKSTLMRTVSPSVSLILKTPSSLVTCHATGFYPSGVMVFWQKDGQEQHEDVEHGETLPNNDGTFQKSTHLTVTPEEWKNNKYQCVVQVTGIKEDFIMVLTESEIKTNWVRVITDDPAHNIVPHIGVVLAVLAIICCCWVCHWKKKQSEKCELTGTTLERVS
ncbi:class I histocompatibility antigen, F10 alpha chain-like [Coregonus clupeaformis]|uniref:class I histocompatibility antigen, F10 alpha chain-like n=1 Tax=Coregonus clupeaformis TaxID=59861 RepID=UPI001E1C7006|nr:class I histocompatibility antigen, F10 alpha chain-like [Coregonus clupeaformis]